MIKYKIEAILIMITRQLLRLLPIVWRFKFSEFLGTLTYYLIKKRRIITYKNLKIAFPDKSEEEIKKIAKKSYKSTARNAIIPLFIAELIEKGYIVPENYELVKELMKRNKGLIITTIHMAGFEAGFFMGKDYNTNVVFKNKGVLVLASDHYSDDVEITFFNKKTRANMGNILLAIKYNAPILFAYSNYDGYKIKLNFLKEVKIEKVGKLKDTLQYNVQNLFYEYEKVIRENPEEYMWQHNRWRD